MSLQPDFRAAFQGLSSPHMILDRNLRYVEANTAYERAVGRSRDELIGQRLFDLFPNDDEAGRKLEASFHKVLATGEPDTLAFLRYDIPRPGEPGAFDTRYWTAVHTPLPGPDGKTAFIVQNTVDVTELRSGEGEGRLRLGLRSDIALLQRAREAEAAKDAASRDASDLRRVFGQAPYFIAILSGPDHVFTFANSAYVALVGDRPLLGLSIHKALPEVADQGYFEMLDRVLATGEPVMMEGARVMLRRAPDQALTEAGSTSTTIRFWATMADRPAFSCRAWIARNTIWRFSTSGCCSTS